MTRVAINGFGRIGRAFLRCSVDSDFDIVAINDIADPANLAYLLKHDTVYGRFEDVSIDGDMLKAGKWNIKIFNEKDPAKLPWREMDVDIAIESTGLFLDHDGAAKHLQAGAKKVILSAPAKGDGANITIVLGVNYDMYDPEAHHIISNASCTTNCIATVAKVLHDSFGIEGGFLSTAHAYTASQKLVDAPEKKWRRGRAAAQSIVLTSTGASKALGLVIPELKGKVQATAIRVPVVCGSVIDFVFHTKKKVSVEAINNAFTWAADSDDLRGILTASDEDLVSSDIIGNSSSSIVDLQSTKTFGENMAQVFAWYDNEWGFCCRMRDLALEVAEQMPVAA